MFLFIKTYINPPLKLVQFWWWIILNAFLRNATKSPTFTLYYEWELSSSWIVLKGLHKVMWFSLICTRHNQFISAILPENATSPLVNGTSPNITTGSLATTTAPPAPDTTIQLRFSLIETFEQQLADTTSQKFKDLANRVTAAVSKLNFLIIPSVQI